MQDIIKTQKNQPYLGAINDFFLLQEQLTKIYFADIKGRDDSIYTWKGRGLDKGRLITGIHNVVSNSIHQGIPHIVVSFPHITTAYRFGDPRVETERETNMYHAGMGATVELEDLALHNDSTIIGCPLEVNPIISEEMLYWITAPSVEAYLKEKIHPIETRFVTNENKLRNFLINNK